MDQRSKAKAVFLEIVLSAGGRFENRTNLYKAFYAAHVYHAHRTGRLLTDWPIVKMPRGPGVESGEALEDDLIQAGLLVRRKPTILHRAYRYEIPDGPSARAHVHDRLDAEEQESVRLAVDWQDGRTALELSALTHKHSRSWNEAQSGQELDIYMDVLSEEEFDRAAAGIREGSATICRVFEVPENHDEA